MSTMLLLLKNFLLLAGCALGFGACLIFCAWIDEKTGWRYLGLLIFILISGTLVLTFGCSN